MAAVKQDGKIRMTPEVKRRLDSVKESQFEPYWHIVKRLLDEHDKKLKRQKGRKNTR